MTVVAALIMGTVAGVSGFLFGVGLYDDDQDTRQWAFVWGAFALTVATLWVIGLAVFG